MLTCGCSEIDFEPGEIRYYFPDDFDKLETSKRKRCTSCKKLIEINSFIVAFDWFKVPKYDIEINIYGEDGEIPRAKTYLCEICGEIYLNLMDLGYCMEYNDNMDEMLKEYHEIENLKKVAR